MERFMLEIYEPGDTSTVLASIQSAYALPIAIGETLNTELLVNDRPKMLLRITAIENTFFPSAEGWSSKRMVYTDTLS